MPEQETNAPAYVVDVQFRPGQKVYFFDPGDKKYEAGDHVIIDTARGPEYGYCTAGNHRVLTKDLVAPLRPVLRKATDSDERIAEQNRTKEKKAMEFCAEKIAELGLDMTLASAECAFDGSKILFFFTAEERVDFRELVKVLAGQFHTRIELRQIGVRDKAKMVGGLGICGRPFCCAEFLDDFQPVSIKMAKTQSLSLNPVKISGTCGRLMCCLKYEQDTYEDLVKRCPKEESFVDTPDGRGTVKEVFPLKQQVKVSMETTPENLRSFAVEEIEVFRNGKAKKTDAPIPEDWAPVSKGGRRSRFRPIEEEPAKLEAVRLRYSDETIAEDLDITETPAVKNGRDNFRRKPKNNKPKSEAKEPRARQKQEAPAPDGGEKKKPRHRYYHKRKPQG